MDIKEKISKVMKQAVDHWPAEYDIRAGLSG